MKYSCNGCRVLRKGCSEDCSIRPCLEWIKSPSSQSNATLFLAKFYGRAGLLNLLSAAPDPLRPSIFRSLLEEACGRIVNPIYGSTGLISSGNWHLCEAAVEAVLNGSPITQIPTESTVENLGTVFNACDIRHVSNKNKNNDKEPLKKSNKVKTQTRFKRSKPKSKTVKPADESSMGDSVGRDGSGVSAVESVETDEDTLAKPNKVGHDVALRLTLGFHTLEKTTATDEDIYGSGNEMADFELRLGLPEVC